MLPACAIEEYASRRLTFVWRIAAALPNVIEAPASTAKSAAQCSAMNVSPPPRPV